MTMAEALMSAGDRHVRVLHRPNTNDWNTLFSCLVHDEYQVRDLPPGVQAVDIGGHCGGATLALLSHGYARVTTVEPLPENCELIREQLELNGWSDRCDVIQGAVSSTHDPVKVCYGDVATESGAHHEFVGNQEGSDVSRYVMAPGVTLADIIDWTGQVDFMKVDCEGGEWALFQHHWPWLFDQIMLITAELHGPKSTGELIADFEKLLGGKFRPQHPLQIHDKGLAAVRLVHK